jgi:hypothetical protein
MTRLFDISLSVLCFLILFQAFSFEIKGQTKIKVVHKLSGSVEGGGETEFGFLKVVNDSVIVASDSLFSHPYFLTTLCDDYLSSSGFFDNFMDDFHRTEFVRFCNVLPNVLVYSFFDVENDETNIGVALTERFQYQSETPNINWLEIRLNRVSGIKLCKVGFASEETKEFPWLFGDE